jgi:alpha-L-glutamate ligase-like protein
MLERFRALKRRGVLAINERNADYILKYNPRSLYPLVDDKLVTKKIAQENGIPVPDLYGAIQVEAQARQLPRMVKDTPDFVVKPAHGRGGEGILVISGRINEKFRKYDGTILSGDEMNHHVFNCLSGLYSLGGQPDTAMIEYRVRFDPTFQAISYEGVPDIRIIVFIGVPVMAMVRLPTRMSKGKANLHQGAIGAGVDMARGRTLTAVWGLDIVHEHPDTGNPVTDVAIPDWDNLLELAAKCYDITGLGYLGVDIVLDRDRGPLLLELNARPGLNIQIANNAGLVLRLERVEEHRSSLTEVASRVAFAKEHFAATADLSRPA